MADQPVPPPFILKGLPFRIRNDADVRRLFELVHKRFYYKILDTRADLPNYILEDFWGKQIRAHAFLKSGSSKNLGQPVESIDLVICRRDDWPDAPIERLVLGSYYGETAFGGVLRLFPPGSQMEHMWNRLLARIPEGKVQALFTMIAMVYVIRHQDELIHYLKEYSSMLAFVIDGIALDLQDLLATDREAQGMRVRVTPARADFWKSYPNHLGTEILSCGKSGWKGNGVRLLIDLRDPVELYFALECSVPIELIEKYDSHRWGDILEHSGPLGVMVDGYYKTRKSTPIPLTTSTS